MRGAQHRPGEVQYVVRARNVVKTPNGARVECAVHNASGMRSAQNFARARRRGWLGRLETRWGC